MWHSIGAFNADESPACPSPSSKPIASSPAHSRAPPKSGFKPMAVVVIDEAGHIKSAQRQDGASMLRIDIATGKAWAAVGMGVASRVLTQRAKDLPAFFNAHRRHRAGQVHPADRRGADQGRRWPDARRGRRQRRHRRRRRVDLRRRRRRRRLQRRLIAPASRRRSFNVRRYAPALASTTTDTPRAGTIASALDTSAAGCRERPARRLRSARGGRRPP